MHEYSKSGRQVLRMLYFLIISMSLTKAISTCLVVDNKFSNPTLEHLALFVVFFSFTTRFCLGAYRVMSENVEVELRRPKIMVDTIGFFFQAMIFYVYSLNYYGHFHAQVMTGVLCFVDLVWLSVLAIGYGIKSKTFSQWVAHNIVFLCFLAVNVFLLKRNTALFLVASAVAFVFDMIKNFDFYFPPAAGGLRIFVAGPYGDKGPKKVIQMNIQRACDVGKELALKGHFPFIPHTMLQGWETDRRFTIDHFKSIDFNWLEHCDALFFIAPSPGANVEKELATRKGIRVFTTMEDVPVVSAKKRDA